MVIAKLSLTRNYFLPSTKGSSEVAFVFNLIMGKNALFQALLPVRISTSNIFLNKPRHNNRVPLHRSYIGSMFRMTTSIHKIVSCLFYCFARTYSSSPRGNAKSRTQILCYAPVEKFHKTMEGYGVERCGLGSSKVVYTSTVQSCYGKSEKAWAYLNKWPKESWSKAFFSIDPKIDNVCNNTCEGFNSSILKYRAKPIVTLLEEIRSYIMRTMTSNRSKLANRSGPLCPMQQSKLEKLKIQRNKWTPLSAGDGRFQVVNAWNSHVDVDIMSNTCTCRMWQLTGMFIFHCIMLKNIKLLQANFAAVAV